MVILKCENCGKTLSENSNFCRICGTPVNAPKEEINNCEITDNIDVSMIKLNTKKNVNETNDDTVEIEEDMEKKMMAMLELTSSYPVLKHNKLDLGNSDDAINSLEVQSTDEIEAIITNDLKTIEEESNNSKSYLDELEEPTMYIPKELNNASNNEDVLLSEDKEFLEDESERRENVSQVKETNLEEKTIQLEEKEEVNNVDDKLEDIKQINSFNDDFMDNSSKKKGHGCIIGFLIMIVVACVGICIYFWLLNNDASKTIKSLKNKNNSLDSQIELLKNKEKEVKKEKSSQLVMNNYLIDLEGIDYSLSENKMLIEYGGKKFTSEIKLDIDYEDLKASKDEYKENFESQKYKVKSYGTKVVEEIEYVVFIVEDESNNLYLIAYTKLEEKDVICFIIGLEDEEFDYSDLNIFNKLVISSSKKSDKESDTLELFGE